MNWTELLVGWVSVARLLTLISVGRVTSTTGSGTSCVSSFMTDAIAISSLSMRKSWIRARVTAT